MTKADREIYRERKAIKRADRDRRRAERQERSRRREVARNNGVTAIGMNHIPIRELLKMRVTESCPMCRRIFRCLPGEYSVGAHDVCMACYYTKGARA